MNIIVVNGYPRSGKDTFIKFCMDEIGYLSKTFSTIDFVKNIALMCGWNGKKQDKDRQFLSNLKQLLVDYNDIPFKQIKKQIELTYDIFFSEGFDTDEAYIFIQCREPAEIEKLVKEFNAVTVFVRKDDCKKDYENSSDNNVENYKYDIVIENNNSITDLQNKAKDFIEIMELRRRNKNE